MKKTFSKLTALLILVTMLTSMLAACSTGAVTGGGNSGSGNNSNNNSGNNNTGNNNNSNDTSDTLIGEDVPDGTPGLIYNSSSEMTIIRRDGTCLCK